MNIYHMPSIRPSSDLRNRYNEVSKFCHKYSEPVYITKNGQGDLAIMSIETYEHLVGKFELYTLNPIFASPFDLRLPEANEEDEETTFVVQPDFVVICEVTKRH